MFASLDRAPAQRHSESLTSAGTCLSPVSVAAEEHLQVARLRSLVVAG
jgi:hypothetical protein